MAKAENIKKGISDNQKFIDAHKDAEYLNLIEDIEFAVALAKTYPDGVPQELKNKIGRMWMDQYDVGAVCDELNGKTELPEYMQGGFYRYGY